LSPSKPSIVKIQGGIGNQLFGLAFAHSVSRLGNGPVTLDVASYGADRYGRAFELEALGRSLGASAIGRWPLRGGRLVTALAAVVAPPGYVRERAPPADEAALAALIARGTYFNGYWQDEAYLAAPDVIRARVREHTLARGGPASSREVVIHYRTYKEDRSPAGRRTPGPDYAREALARIEARLGRAREVCLVSDDPDLAREKLGDIGRPLTVVAGAGPWADLALLTRARALILTNSSFSWWGGFCGEAELVTYPRRDGYVHYPIPAARFEVI
jgi:hypothetical protein